MSRILPRIDGLYCARCHTGVSPSGSSRLRASSDGFSLRSFDAAGERNSLRGERVPPAGGLRNAVRVAIDADDRVARDVGAPEDRIVSPGRDSRKIGLADGPPGDH